MKRIALKLAYMGTEYHGFQIQPGVPTIEGKILKALRELGAIKNTGKARYSAAGRTDRGVHALGQVIVFDTENPASSMPRALNSKLEHIWAYAWADVDSDFSARRSATEREYRYMLWGKELDVSRVEEASAILLGTHDFRNFIQAEKDRSTFCDIKRVSIQGKGDWIYIDIAANRFLWHMVRKIATALKLIGKGEKDKRWLEKMLDLSLDEKLEPLDAQGLILKDVKYEGIKWNIDAYARDRALEELHELFMKHEIAAKMLQEIENSISWAR
ncbi:MAG: tRNA pseudouridine(38-40) synthase TruA [Candidatus Methanoperedens sp.]|nr:tRNA pseudouridine(38-40) synthase TruA [Candidatus Methanoperedens sp.]